MPNTKDAEIGQFHRILLVGRTGSGKSSQVWTLPGRKFAYIFDPNAMSCFKRRDASLDMDYEAFLPDVTEMDATIKGFNRDSRSDRLASQREPTVYTRWVEDINEKVEAGFFANYDWLIADSLTFQVKALMDRVLFLNKRYGDVPDLSDYRVAGLKLSDIWTRIAGLPINILATGHLDVFEEDKTKRIETLLSLPGQARKMLPLVFTDIWQALPGEGDKFMVRTKPDARGLQDIRSSFPLQPLEDVTIPRFDASAAGKYGIGRLLSKAKP